MDKLSYREVRQGRRFMIRVLPGTGMVDIALRDGQIDPDDNLLYPKFYISAALEDRLVELMVEVQ